MTNNAFVRRLAVAAMLSLPCPFPLQAEDVSKGAYGPLYARRLMTTWDKDNNGTIGKSEPIQQWRLYGSSDSNQDGSLSREALSKANPFSCYLATCTKENAAFHWGETPPGRWSLFDLASDIKCEHDLSPSRQDIVTRLAGAYHKWWDDLYPSRMGKGGDKGVPEPLGGNPKE